MTAWTGKVMSGAVVAPMTENAKRRLWLTAARGALRLGKDDQAIHFANLAANAGCKKANTMVIQVSNTGIHHVALQM